MELKMMSEYKKQQDKGEKEKCRRIEDVHSPMWSGLGRGEKLPLRYTRRYYSLVKQNLFRESAIAASRCNMTGCG